MVEQLRDIGGSAVVAGEHVLGVTGVSRAPGLVVQFVDDAGAMVALVEGDGDKAWGRGASCGVVGGDDLGCEGRHGVGVLETGVQ